MADDFSKQNKNYQEALKAAEKLVQTHESMEKSSQKVNEVLGSISSSLLGLSESVFFKKIPKSNEDLAESARQIQQIKDKVGTAGDALNQGFDKRLESIKKKFKGLENTSLSMNVKFNEEDVKKFHEYNRGQLTDLSADEKIRMKEISEFNKELLKNQEDINELMVEEYGKEWDSIIDGHSDFLVGKFKEAAVQGDIAKFVKEEGQDARDLLMSLEGHTSELSKQVQSYDQLTKNSKELIGNLKNSNKEVFTMRKAIEEIGDRFAKKIIGTLMKFDQALSTAQKNTGVMFKENSVQMSHLTSETAAFGMSIEDTTAMMGDLGDELRTTDFGVLSQAAKDFAAIQLATGVSSKEITTIAGELMRAGVSSGDMSEAIQNTVKDSKMLGVNSKRVIQQMEKNIDKMRKFGFTGGIESLRKMAVEAERLRINVDSIFNVAERARSIEGAMEMAAELQLAGGSFAAINPMDLLSAARKGPKEMQNILKTMGKDIGSFNKKGEFIIDPVDSDRLRMVAESTGMAYEDLSNMIQKTADDARKMEKFQGGSFMSFSDEDKAFVTEMTKIGEGGTLKVKTESKDLLKDAGIDDITMITPDQLKKLKDLREKQAGDLKSQAAANASFQEAMTGLANSFMHMFTMFEPAIILLSEAIGSIAQFIGELPDWGKNSIVAGSLFLLAVTKMGGMIGLFQKTVGLFTGGIKDMAKNVVSKVMGSKGGGAKDMASKVLSNDESGAMDKANKVKSGGGIAGFVKSLKQASKEAAKISMKGVLKFASSMAIIGSVLVGFGAAMAAFGGEASMDQLITMGASLVLLGGSMILFSKLAGAIDIKNLVKFSLAMALVGGGLLLFGMAADTLTNVDLVKVLASIGLLTLVIVGLALLGAMMTGPQILGLLVGVGILVSVSAGLLLFASSLLVAGIAFDKMAGINWSGFAEMGPALMSVIPGLLGFSVAAMSFLNPLTLLGFITMTATLGTFAAIMIPLADALAKGADGFDRFAEGVNSLKEATADLDFEKLEKLSELSQGLAGASVMANIASSLSDMVKGSGGSGSSGGGGSQTVKHEVTLKLNGRDLQRFIIEDTDLQS